MSSLATQTWMSQWTCTVELAIGCWFSSMNSKTVYEYRSKSFAAQVSVELKQKNNELLIIQILRGVQVEWSPSLNAGERFWVVSVAPEVVVEGQVVVPYGTLSCSEDSVGHRRILDIKIYVSGQKLFFTWEIEKYIFSPTRNGPTAGSAKASEV